MRRRIGKRQHLTLGTTQLDPIHVENGLQLGDLKVHVLVGKLD
jgi:hypothetical protein